MNRRQCHFKIVYACTTLKQKCVSVYGVKLWNSLNTELKCCKKILENVRNEWQILACYEKIDIWIELNKSKPW